MGIGERLEKALGYLTVERVSAGVMFLLMVWNRVRGSLKPQAALTTNKENGMNKVAVTMEVPKESKEVIDAVVGLIADIKAKKSISEIAGAALPKVIAAVDGFDQLGEEVKSDGKDELAGYAVRELLQGLGV